MAATYQDGDGVTRVNQIERTLFRVLVGDLDITAQLRPILHALHISDRAGQTTDTCDITIDDTGGRVVMPPADAPLQVWLADVFAPSGGTSLVQVFSGHVDEIRSKGGRSEGRLLTITAKGMDTTGRSKEPVEAHYDNASLNDVLTKAATAVGVKTVKVDPALGAIVRQWWGQQSESLIHFGQRLAREVGGTFKIVGDTAILAKRGTGTSASGLALPGIVAAWGVNLIEWDIAPVITRGRYTAAKGRFYDSKHGKYRGSERAVRNPSSTATHVIRNTKADEGEADTHAAGDAEASDRQAGMGTVHIDGNTAAQPEANCQVTGTRPGIDGTYRIDGLTHELSRAGGFVTTLEIKQPQGTAGIDQRATPGATRPATPLPGPSAAATTLVPSGTATSSGSDVPPVVDAPASTSAVTQALVAGSAISGHRALMYDAVGRVAHADPGTTGYAFAGISVQAAAAGSPLQVVDIGPVTEVSWSWTPLAAVFVGPLGVLTQTPPTSGISHIIGYATAAQTLMLAPQTPILIE